jgi:hypothetical protein
MSSTTFRRNGAVKNVPFGFSWTSFFFGFIPSLIRGHWSMVWLAIFADALGLFLSGWVFQGKDAFGSVLAARCFVAIFANGTYAEHLRDEGWTDKEDAFRFLPPINED